MNKKTIVNTLVIFVAFAGQIVHAQKFAPIDAKATKETKALFKNLKELSDGHVLFGHQSATEYGHGWSGEAGRSDVKSVTGSHPAVVGIDFNGLSSSSPANIARSRVSLKKNIEDTYNRGGITTVAWHFNNPVSNTSFYSKDSGYIPAVPYIIPGGSHHEKYKQILATIADFAKTCKGNDGNVVPMIFRPFHEFDGEWFWWGKPQTSKEDFIKLWQFTVTYLRDSLQVHNFIYAFSPDNKFNNEEQYLERYPGNAFVDLVGVDNYGDFGRDNKYNVEAGVKKLQVVSDYAKKSGKLAAFTETGLESIPNATWFTETLLKALKTKGLQLCYVLVWRNDSRSQTHFYAPYPGHSSVPDFLQFYNDPFTLFENDLKKIYQ
ncbi:MAG TPA: glycosyl hydrolase [Segetibacter sp.]|jgi:mannan endo-1,4-beta-mannosidase